MKLKTFLWTLRRPHVFWHPRFIDRDQPHQIACFKHRNRLQRPAFCDVQVGQPMPCEVHV